MNPILYAVIGLAVGLVLSVVLVKALQKQVQEGAEIKAQDLVKDARRKAEDMTRDAQRKAKEAVEQAKRKAEQEERTKLDEVRRAETNAKDIERKLEKERKEVVEVKERAAESALKSEKAAAEYERLKKSTEQMEEKYRTRQEEINREFERIASMTQKEARESLLKAIEDDVKLSGARMVREIEEAAKDEAEKAAKRIISIAISRYSSEYIPERTTSMVHLPNDEMKGRLIGREGRNIRAIEAATGCDLIVDDTPETVVVSCFDPVRRHIGKNVLERLIADGRIHPGRIEELVEKVTSEVNNTIKEAGKNACVELGIVNMHPELMKVLGQLQFRFSYTQNQYYHVIEAGHLCGLMASELGLDVKRPAARAYCMTSAKRSRTKPKARTPSSAPTSARSTAKPPTSSTRSAPTTKTSSPPRGSTSSSSVLTRFPVPVLAPAASSSTTTSSASKTSRTSPTPSTAWSAASRSLQAAKSVSWWRTAA
jgi:ribonuclease Y